MAAIALFLRGVWGVVGPILTFGITLPVWAFLIAGAWFYFDKSSDIRKAVDKAVAELVAGAELEAARAREKGLLQINAVLVEDKRKLEAANMAFAESLAATETKLENANGQIDRILARPGRIKCPVDRPIFDSLRNK